ncbi:hypothetical protein Bca52824_033050 [Brassica carinata]|uniref:Uncharacterized protein n=1 Tax=Brassica carinata TaxID=52824 RepID=A0A8X7SC50_BRACI|nr:hypothetical protein Bca52824_033050 [Brassica carinata]
MTTRQKEKELEKSLSTPEQTPKDLTRTVVRPRRREDLELSWTCEKSKSSRKGKEAAGVSGQVETDGANPVMELPIQMDGTNVETGPLIAQLDPTEFRMDGAGQELGPADGAERVHHNHPTRSRLPGRPAGRIPCSVQVHQAVRLTPVVSPLSSASSSRPGAPTRTGNPGHGLLRVPPDRVFLSDGTPPPPLLRPYIEPTINPVIRTS